MTKEQEKAIETMKHWIDFEKHNRDKINKADDLIKIQETVLNMIKERDEEIENNKKKNKELSNQILKLYKEQDNYNARIENKNTEIAKKDKRLTRQSKLLIKKDNELKKKDKQINLMADFIDKTGAGRRAFSCTFRKNGKCNENGCRECIKQYFKRKATNNG